MYQKCRLFSCQCSNEGKSCPSNNTDKNGIIRTLEKKLFPVFLSQDGYCHAHGAGQRLRLGQSPSRSYPSRTEHRSVWTACPAVPSPQRRADRAAVFPLGLLLGSENDVQQRPQYHIKRSALKRSIIAPFER